MPIGISQAAPNIDLKVTMCNIPQDMLIKQLAIEAIPSTVILLILLISTIVCVSWWYKSKENMSVTYSRTVIICICIVFFPLWWKCSFIATNVATSVFNTEYAALTKFAQGCPSAMK